MLAEGKRPQHWGIGRGGGGGGSGACFGKKIPHSSNHLSDQTMIDRSNGGQGHTLTKTACLCIFLVL